MAKFESLENASFEQVRTFKGRLRCEIEEDAELYCRCNPLNKKCEQCSYYKDHTNFYYSTKLNKIYAIPDSMLFKENMEISSV